MTESVKESLFGAPASETWGAAIAVLDDRFHTVFRARTALARAART